MLDASVWVIKKVERFMRKYAAETSRSSVCNDDFDALARDVFAYQFAHNPTYRKLCLTKRKTPQTVRCWQDIVPVPLQAFKELDMCCEPISEQDTIFMTSGTTGDKRGRNYHPEMGIWDLSMRLPFQQFVLPEGHRKTVLLLSPTTTLNPHSSLARYLSNALVDFGNNQSRCLYNAQSGLDIDGFTLAVHAAIANQQPVLLMGATFSYVHLFDTLCAQGRTLPLPRGSIVFDTGGLKGQVREVSPEWFSSQIETLFGVQQENCINMYGMTELSSQLYDQHFYRKHHGQRVVRDKLGPAWIRTVVVHSETLLPVPDGEVGLLIHYDLANWNACVAILTEDVGYQTDCGFVLLGRAQGAEARGCSLAIDQLMQAQKQD